MLRTHTCTTKCSWLANEREKKTEKEKEEEAKKAYSRQQQQQQQQRRFETDYLRDPHAHWRQGIGEARVGLRRRSQSVLQHLEQYVMDVAGDAAGSSLDIPLCPPPHAARHASTQWRKGR